MIRPIFAVLFSLLSLSLWAMDPMEYRHQISFGSKGVGWSGAAEQIPGESGSNFKRVDFSMTNFGINYAYLFTNRIQVGGYFTTMKQEHRFKKKGGGDAPAEIESTMFGLFGLYNFSDDISNAYFAGPSISTYAYTEENSQELESAEGKAPFELDDAGMVYELVFGKRFTLKRWNIEHITFAPQISAFYRTHSKDFDDQMLKNGVGTNIQPIKFDFLF